MAADTLKAGDTVRLKSGGPIMTIEAGGHDGEWVAVWFAGNKLRSGKFPAVTLEPAKPDPSPKQHVLGKAR
jgi:uncharacterized protein YodC (DUF2158 family)